MPFWGTGYKMPITATNSTEGANQNFPIWAVFDHLQRIACISLSSSHITMNYICIFSTNSCAIDSRNSSYLNIGIWGCSRRSIHPHILKSPPIALKFWEGGPAYLLELLIERIASGYCLPCVRSISRILPVGLLKAAYLIQFCTKSAHVTCR
jgi:hypothetical protein